MDSVPAEIVPLANLAVSQELMPVLVVVIVQDAAISPICTFNRDFIIRRLLVCG